MSPINWHPLRFDDLPEVHALLLAAAAVDDADHVEPLADLQEQFDDPWSDPAVEARVGVTPEGGVVVMGRGFHNPDPAADPHVFLDYEVHPAWRGGEAETAILDWLEARGAERLRDKAGGRLRVGVENRQTARLALMQARGYAPLRYFYRMARDLTQPIPAAALPAGLTLSGYTPDLEGPLLAAHNAAFADHWDFEPITPPEWQQFFIRAESFRPDLTLVVKDGEQIAAYSFNRVHAAGNARRGVKEAHIGSLGTCRPWRKLGLASFLLAESMRRFQAAGYDCATLGVDAANPSGAVRLYERLGFQPVREFTVLEKPAG